MGLLKQLEIKFELSIVEDFLTHYEIMCIALEPIIINLAKKKNFNSGIEELINIFHNISSSSSYLELDTILKLSSLAENILKDVKNEKSSQSIASHELIDWLLLVADQLEIYRQNIENDEVYFHILNPQIVKLPINIILNLDI